MSRRLRSKHRNRRIRKYCIKKMFDKIKYITIAKDGVEIAYIGSLKKIFNLERRK